METKLKDSITDATVFYFIHGGATVLKKHSGVAYDVFQFRFHKHMRVDFKEDDRPFLYGPWPLSFFSKLTEKRKQIKPYYLLPVYYTERRGSTGYEVRCTLIG